MVQVTQGASHAPIMGRKRRPGWLLFGAARDLAGRIRHGNLGFFQRRGLVRDRSDGLINYVKEKGIIPMASEILKLTAEIVASHASMTELTTTELVKEIREIYRALSSLASKVVVPIPESAMARSAGSVYQKPRSRKMMESPEAKAVEDEEKPVLGDPDYLEFMASREG